MLLNYTTFKAKRGTEWVVFLHGIGGGSGIWLKQIRAFQKHYNLLLIDLPGHGQSPYGLKDMEEKSFVSIANEVLKVLDHEHIKQAHFAGISLGTIVIQTLHDSFPERVQSMILGGAVEKVNLPAKLIIKVANTLKHFMPYMWLYKISALILMPKHRHRESRCAFIKEAYNLGQKEFLQWFYLHTQVEETIEQFKEKAHNTPKIYIMGSEDYMFLPHIQENVNISQTNETLRIIENCGHVCNIERHREFNELGLEFLSSLQKNESVA